MSIMGIYKITNIENNKIYIGSSVDIEKRWTKHVQDLNNNKHHSYKLQEDWNKYSPETFEFEIVNAMTDEEMLRDIEQLYLSKYKPYKDGYNVADQVHYGLPIKIQEWTTENDGFVFFLCKFGENRFKDLNISLVDMAKLFYLATFINYEGYIIYKKKMSKRSNVRELLNLSSTAFDDFYYKLKKLNILIQDENKYIKINNDYFIKGKVKKQMRKHSGLTRVSCRGMQYLYNKLDKNQHVYIGYLCALCSFLNKETNVLSFDINGKDYITVLGIQHILPLHEDSIRRAIGKMKKITLEDGMPMIKMVKPTKNDKNLPIAINPSLFYGGNFELPTGELDMLKWFK